MLNDGNRAGYGGLDDKGVRIVISPRQYIDFAGKEKDYSMANSFLLPLIVGIILAFITWCLPEAVPTGVKAIITAVVVVLCVLVALSIANNASDASGTTQTTNIGVNHGSITNEVVNNPTYNFNN